MDLTITGRNLSLSDSLQDYVRRRLARLDRRLRKTVPVRVLLRHEETRSVDTRYVAEVTAALKGGVVIRGEQRASNINAAIDGVADSIVRQIDRYRTRRMKGRRDGRGIAELEMEAAAAFVIEEIEEPAGEAQVPDSDEPDSSVPPQKVVRVKRHEVLPMTVEQAAQQMDLLGHAFYLFQNSEDGTMNVVYRRHDGAYGLIVPQKLAVA